MRKFFYLIFTFLATVNIIYSLTLEEALDLAEKNNRMLKSLEYQKKAAKYLKYSSISQFFPKIFLQAGYNKFYDLPRVNMEDNILIPTIKFVPTLVSDSTGQPIMTIPTPIDPNASRTAPAGTHLEPIPYYNNAFLILPQQEFNMIGDKSKNVTVLLTQPIFTGFKLINLYKIASISEKTTQIMLEKQKKDIAYKVTEAYYNLAKVIKYYNFTLEAERVLDTILYDLNNLYEQNLVKKTDVLKIEIEKNKIKEFQIKAESGVKLARNYLNVLIGLPIDSVYEVDTSIILDTNIIELPENIVDIAKQREEVKLIENNIELLKKQRNIALSRFLPNINLTASLIYTPDNDMDITISQNDSLKQDILTNVWAESPLDPNSSQEFFDMKKENTIIKSIGINLTWEIFSSGDRFFNVSSVNSRINSLEEEKKEIIDYMVLDIKKKHDKLIESLKVLETAQKNVEETKLALEYAKLEFKEGTITIREYLQAYLDYVKANTEYFDKLSQFMTNKKDYERSIGKIK